MSRAYSTRMRGGLARALAAGLALCAAVARGAHEELGAMLFTVGTTAQDTNGVHWAYLLWQASDPGVAPARAFAVYARPGSADATGAFARRGLAQVVTDPYAIRQILARAEALGDDLGVVEESVDALFAQVIPTNALPLEAKLGAVMEASRRGDDVLGELFFTAHRHPAIAMCLGQAFACPVGEGLTTFEVRASDPAGVAAGAVVGRVTVEAGRPVVLPAPSALREVPEASPKGHLNVRLRWDVPPALRRFALLNFGFNVYRMPRAFAEDPSRSFHLNPPGGAQLRALAASEAAVALVNRSPVMAAGEGAVPEEPFFIDDNDRYDPGGVPFHNGDEYYYFATALDVLGRDGDASAACLVRVCDRMPPSAPQGLAVRNVYTYEGGVRKQALEVSWLQNRNASDDVTSVYVVYRWRTFTGLVASASNPAYAEEGIFGPFAHLEGTNRLSYLDEDFDSNDYSRVTWYTVRALDNGACGGNYSAASEPAWGVFRDWEGPEGPGGLLGLSCTVPLVSWMGAQNVGSPESRWQIVCERRDPGIAWVELRYGAERYADLSEATNDLGRLYFAEGSDAVSTDVLPFGAAPAITVYGRAGLANDRATDYAVGMLNRESGTFLRGTFEAWTTNRLGLLGVDCDHHDAVAPGQEGIAPVGGLVFRPAGAKSYRVFRRIDDGEHQLVASGDFGEALWALGVDISGGIVAQCAKVCYYAQVLDEHGNPSPTFLLGCFAHSGAQPLPQPLLSPIRGEAVGGAPHMRLRWFCPPPGVERFEVWVAAEPGGPPASLCAGLSSNLLPQKVTKSIQTTDGKQATLSFGKYRTGRLGVGFGKEGDTKHLLDVPVVTGVTYTVFVKAIGLEGVTAGPDGNAESFTWHPPVPDDLPEVPWPARGLPAVLGPATSNLQPVMVVAGAYGSNMVSNDQAAVRIGWADLHGYPDDARDILPGTNAPPWSFLYPEMQGPTSLWPFVLYRCQVTNALFPRVSADVVQVSPLHEAIACAPYAAPEPPHLAVLDPFFRVLPRRPYYAWWLHDVLALDPQPVIRGADYRYFVVQMDNAGELRRVIPTDVLHVPENP